MELVVADPSAATQETTKGAFQSLFTKSSTQAQQLSTQEMCQRLLRSMDDNRRAAHFLMKQFVVDSSTRNQRSGDVGRAYEKLREDFTQFKQATNSSRIESEQAIAHLQNRVQGKSSKQLVFMQICGFLSKLCANAFFTTQPSVLPFRKRRIF
jgi:hypothetical protein